MKIETCIEHINSEDPRLQCKAAVLMRLEDYANSILPLLVERAKQVDVDAGEIEINYSNFVGEAAKTSAKLIRKIGCNDHSEFHRQVKNWILELNYCSELNAAAHSVSALGDLWTPPELVRTRLIDLVHVERRPDNKPENAGTIRGLAFRELTSRDREAARLLINTPARRDFEEFINYQLDYYRSKYPNNNNMPQRLWSEIAWLDKADAV